MARKHVMIGHVAAKADMQASQKRKGCLLTAGQSALERLSVVGMSALKLSSSNSYMKAVLLGKNCSLTLIFRELKMASNTPLPVLVWNFVSCTNHTEFCASQLQRDCYQLHTINQGQDILYGTCAGVSIFVLHNPDRMLPQDIGKGLLQAARYRPGATGLAGEM